MSLTPDFPDAHGGIATRLSSLFALLRVSGEDAEAFLQGQLTCDVKALPSGSSIYGAYCTAKGRALANFLIWRTQDGFMLMLAADIAETTKRRLQMFVLRAKVKIETEAASLIGVAGPQAGAVLDAAGYQPAVSTSLATVLQLEELRFLVCLNDAQQAEMFWTLCIASLKAEDPERWQWLDIVRGIPWIGAATQEQFVPQMINLEKIGGISFKKGCYPGQEIVARTQYLGKANRRMHLAHSDTALQAGEEIYADSMGDQACGMVANVAVAPQGGWDALIVVHNTALHGAVHARSINGPVLSFRPLPYAVSD